MAFKRGGKVKGASRIPGVAVGEGVKTSIGEKKKVCFPACRQAGMSAEPGSSGWWIRDGGRLEDRSRQEVGGQREEVRDQRLRRHPRFNNRTRGKDN